MSDDDIHQHCSLSRKSVGELTEICAESVDRKDWSNAYHCAVHHVLMCHNGVNSDQAKFFLDTAEAAGPTNMVMLMCNELTSDCFQKVGKSLEEKSDEFQFQMVAKMMMNQIGPEIRDAMIVPALGMTTFSIYVFTKGKGCLFSLIDEDLCKESIS